MQLPVKWDSGASQTDLEIMLSEVKSIVEQTNTRSFTYEVSSCHTQTENHIQDGVTVRLRELYMHLRIL